MIDKRKKIMLRKGKLENKTVDAGILGPQSTLGFMIE